MSSIVSDRRGVINAGCVPTDPLQSAAVSLLIPGGRVEVDGGGGGGVGAGELASPLVSSASGMNQSCVVRSVNM